MIRNGAGSGKIALYGAGFGRRVRMERNPVSY
jgi:hypothetical protein